MSNSVTTNYKWFGESGPVVVLIHGLGLNLKMWKGQIPALSKNFRVLCYDIIGHGETPYFGQEQSLTLFSEQLNLLLDEQEISSCAVVGFSLGGMIARRFAMDHSDRLQALVILNSPHARSEEQQQAIEKRVRQAEKQGPASTVDAALKRWFTDEYRQSNHQVMQQVKTWVLANNVSHYHLTYDVLAQGVIELVNPNPPITTSTLVMTCEYDYGQPATMANAIAAEIPGSQCIIVPKLRHMGLVEAPQTFNPVLSKFLSHHFSAVA